MISKKICFTVVFKVSLFLQLCVHISHCMHYSFEPPNLKTVLFQENHLRTRCWSSHEVNLLFNRRKMQDLIPRKIPKDLPIVLKYLKSVEDISQQMAPGLNRTLVTLAIADVIGSYLQAIVIPIANEAYYAGNVDYTTVAGLHNMLDKWKRYLSTDGGTWSQECDMRKVPTQVTVLELSLHDREAACRELYVSTPPHISKQQVGSQIYISEPSRIAIPYLDNDLMPSALALPFKKRNLISLIDPDSAYILVKYYTLVMRCLSGNESDVLAFNNFFHVWILSKVVPHLHDQNRWYPAFGAVMRIAETIKQKGLALANPTFVQPLSDDHQESALNTNLVINAEGPSLRKSISTEGLKIFQNHYAMFVALGILLIIILIICFFILYFRRQRKKSTVFLCDISDGKNLKNALLSLYCASKGSWVGVDTKVNYKPLQANKKQNKSGYRHDPSYPHNTPASSDVSLSITSDSENENPSIIKRDKLTYLK